MATGIVKFFKADRGFGFIAPDEGGDDVFVHVSAIPGKQPLHQGMRVGFELGTDSKSGKAKATSVRLL